jgi:hypothetical protein
LIAVLRPILFSEPLSPQEAGKDFAENQIWLQIKQTFLYLLIDVATVILVEQRKCLPNTVKKSFFGPKYSKHFKIFFVKYS